MNFLDIIYPKFCLGCHREGTYLCPDCFSQIPLRSLQCPICGIRVPDGKLCPACRQKNDLALFGFAAASFYSNPLVRDTIENLKYKFVQESSQALADIVIKFVRFNPLLEFAKNPDNFIICPIPLHPRRLRWRGFNQAQTIAQIVASSLNIPLKNDIIVRKRYTQPQASFTDEQKRAQNIKDCFAIAPFNKNLLKRKKIILFDDVAHTFSTLNEAAKCLREEGARQVWGLTVAK